MASITSALGFNVLQLTLENRTEQSMSGISKKEFIRRYSTSLLEGNAALFAGAGLSIPAGFADWRKLLKEIADDLQLDIEREHDLIAVAQYEANRKGNRDSLDEAIIRQFDREARLTENHRIIARLPIDTVWTTNYDKVLEKAFVDANKRPDVKITVPQLALRRPHSDVVIFKMHGDVEHAHDAILTKDDYECYETECGAFTMQLLADLLSKRFLFLGFSFTDPNRHRYRFDFGPVSSNQPLWGLSGLIQQSIARGSIPTVSALAGALRKH